MKDELEDYFEKTAPFTIKIGDGISEYEYTFHLSENISIHDIVKMISNHYDVTVPRGKIIS